MVRRRLLRVCRELLQWPSGGGAEAFDWFHRIRDFAPWAALVVAGIVGYATDLVSGVWAGFAVGALAIAFLAGAAIVRLIGQLEKYEHLSALIPVGLEEDTSTYLQRWWNVEVHNPNPDPIKQCFAKVSAYRKLDVVGEWDERRNKMPLSGLKLMWRVGPGDQARAYADIGGGSRDWFSLATAQSHDSGYQQVDFQLPQPSPSIVGGTMPYVTRPLTFEYPLPAGTYEMEVEIGSETESLPPAHMAVRLIYKGGLDLQVTVID
jgi:hypothetical protein